VSALFTQVCYGEFMEKNKEQKTYTYIVLVSGLLIWIFYFYHGRNDFLTTRFYRTEYSEFFDDIFNDIFSINVKDKVTYKHQDDDVLCNNLHNLDILF
jgi:hypothetical protein